MFKSNSWKNSFSSKIKLFQMKYGQNPKKMLHGRDSQQSIPSRSKRFLTRSIQVPTQFQHHLNQKKPRQSDSNKKALLQKKSSSSSNGLKIHTHQNRSTQKISGNLGYHHHSPQNSLRVLKIIQIPHSSRNTCHPST